MRTPFYSRFTVFFVLFLLFDSIVDTFFPTKLLYFVSLSRNNKHGMYYILEKDTVVFFTSLVELLFSLLMCSHIICWLFTIVKFPLLELNCLEFPQISREFVVDIVLRAVSSPHFCVCTLPANTTIQDKRFFPLVHKHKIQKKWHFFYVSPEMFCCYGCFSSLLSSLTHSVVISTYISFQFSFSQSSATRVVYSTFLLGPVFIFRPQAHIYFLLISRDVHDLIILLQRGEIGNKTEKKKKVLCNIRSTRFESAFVWRVKRYEAFGIWYYFWVLLFCFSCVSSSFPSNESSQ